jgi:hypothetical protein
MTKLPGITSTGARRLKGKSPGPARPMTASRPAAAAKESPAAGPTNGKRPTYPTYPRLVPGRRPENGVGEWLAVMVRGLDALDFLERSRDLASEPVSATPVQSRHRPC